MNITMLRVLLINVGQLAGNEIITGMLSPFFHEKSQILLNLSAVLASLTTSFLSLPADNIKVKMQKQTPDVLLYSGVSDCFMKSIQREGFIRLWVGFPVYLLRGMPHSFVLIRTQQFLKEQFLNKEWPKGKKTTHPFIFICNTFNNKIQMLWHFNFIVWI